MLVLSVLKNLIQRTSRRLKRTSGGRDTIMQILREGGRLIKGGTPYYGGGVYYVFESNPLRIPTSRPVQNLEFHPEPSLEAAQEHAT